MGDKLSSARRRGTDLSRVIAPVVAAAIVRAITKAIGAKVQRFSPPDADVPSTTSAPPIRLYHPTVGPGPEGMPWGDSGPPS